LSIQAIRVEPRDPSSLAMASDEVFYLKTTRILKRRALW